MRSVSRAILLAALAVSLPAATLERLTLEEMARKSTAVVVGRLQDSAPLSRGALIYTQFRFQVKETWKGAPSPAVVVTVPGGETSTHRQTFSGAPGFQTGQDYLLFLWTGRNGLTQVIGLAQGAFQLRVDPQGRAVAVRSPISDTLLDPVTGAPVEDRGLQVLVDDLHALVKKAAQTAN